jgi:hypothetical protein
MKTFQFSITGLLMFTVVVAVGLFLAFVMFRPTPCPVPHDSEIAKVKLVPMGTLQARVGWVEVDSNDARKIVEALRRPSRKIINNSLYKIGVQICIETIDGRMIRYSGDGDLMGTESGDYAYSNGNEIRELTRVVGAKVMAKARK